MLFKDLAIIEQIQKALKENGYEKPTPIQEKSIPETLLGNDLLGCAQTGTGKTAAFAVPVIQNIFKEEMKTTESKKPIKALILAPTRELAIQIGENFDIYSKYTGITNTVIFGGVSQNPQTKILKKGVDILIATPGRLLDLVNQRFVDLNNVRHFILDEADRMLDMGMINDVKRIISKLPKERQNMLFSATMPKEIAKLVDSILKNPVKIEVAPVSSTVDTINQGLYFVGKSYKKKLLIDILQDKSITSLLVFSRTKRGANNITKDLAKAGVEALAIHGNKSQGARQLALRSFKEGKIRVLVATDIAARGIDVSELPYVINYDLPEDPESYVHRIGRTGRAGNKGTALSFCDASEKELLKSIEKLIKKSIPVIDEHSYPEGNTSVEKKVLSHGSEKKGSGNKHNNGKGNVRGKNNFTRGNSYGKESSRQGKPLRKKSKTSK